MEPKVPAINDCRVVEFFAGLGGFSAACASLACEPPARPSSATTAAIDIDRNAEATYRLNFNHPFHVREIESLTDREIIGFDANFWWLSPPCQPYSRRGRQLDTEDPRARPLLRLIKAIPVCRPHTIALENVLGFANSESLRRLRRVLQQAGYCVQTLQLCPSEMGWPNRRPRFYLLASLAPLLPWKSLPKYVAPLLSFLEPQGHDESESLWLPDEVVGKYESAFDRVDGTTAQVTACFGSSYGKSLLHAGSYLRQGASYRYFSPREVARLLGFADSFELGDLSQRAAWKLLGNSLSLPAVRYVLEHL